MDVSLRSSFDESLLGNQFNTSRDFPPQKNAPLLCNWHFNFSPLSSLKTAKHLFKIALKTERRINPLSHQYIFRMFIIN